ncbi:MAG: N-acetylmuramic acid 6-phosphate etherase [Phycisphaerales bacterium]|nr:N-acetylmuramic acid 6-phosphate etherase [Phycisphaerales bacterium]
MPTPPDRGHISTERRPRTTDVPLESRSTADIVRLITADQRSALAAVEAQTADVAIFIDQLVARMRSGGRLIYLGAGTSGRLGVLDASECPPTFGADPGKVVGLIAGGDTSLRRSSEAKEDDPSGAAAELESLAVASGDTVLGIAAGGTTPWVLGAIEEASRRGAATALLSCCPRECPPGCDQLIVVDTGAELLTGSTRLKAGTATKATLNAITTTAFIRLGAVHGDLMVDLRATNDKLLDRAIRILLAFAPHLSREEAAARIEASDGHLKAAIVAVRCELTPEDARQRLDRCEGSLRDALEHRR